MADKDKQIDSTGDKKKDNEKKEEEKKEPKDKFYGKCPYS